MATILYDRTVRLERSTIDRIDDLAERLSSSPGHAMRLVIRVGLDAIRRDPSLILGGDPAPASPASPVPGLPIGARTRGGAA